MTKTQLSLLKVRQISGPYVIQAKATPAGFIPGDPNSFSVQLSDRLAEFIPALTLDFISEVIAGMGKSIHQRINCLQYMSPWIKNLTHFPNPTSPHYEHSGARLRDCIRALTDLTLKTAEVCSIQVRYYCS